MTLVATLQNNKVTALDTSLGLKPDCNLACFMRNCRLSYIGGGLVKLSITSGELQKHLRLLFITGFEKRIQYASD